MRVKLEGSDDYVLITEWKHKDTTYYVDPTSNILYNKDMKKIGMRKKAGKGFTAKLD